MLTKTDLNQISKIVKFENKASEKRIDRKLDKVINFLDRDYIKLLERIEKHLQLTPVS